MLRNGLFARVEELSSSTDLAAAWAVSYAGIRTSVCHVVELGRGAASAALVTAFCV